MPPEYYFEAIPPPGLIGTGGVALFLDFDGTLVPIRKDPAQCYLSPATQCLLGSILRSGRSAVSLVSGRSLADLLDRAFVPGAYHVGSHGLEISGPGMQFIHPDARRTKSVIDAICDDVGAATGGCEGVTVEKKPYSFALHFREAERGSSAFLRRFLEQSVATRSDGRGLVTIARGKKVLEVVPRTSWNKGLAALRIARKLGDGFLPVCVGDDSTDETLFETFREAGLTVRVGPSQRTSAMHYLKRQREVHLLLEQINAALVRHTTLTVR